MRQPNINRRGKIFRSKAAGLATLALVAWAYSGNTLLPGVNATLDENGEAIKELCEAANKSYSNITDQLVEYTDYGNGIFFGVFHPDNKACRGDYVLPIFPSEVLWSDGFRATLYALALCYCFLGVALISDIFMSAIEVITAKEVKVMKEDEQGQMKEHTVLFWNETIANLSLMALGSSAPEILLSVVETVGKLGQPPVNGRWTLLPCVLGRWTFRYLVT